MDKDSDNIFREIGLALFWIAGVEDLLTPFVQLFQIFVFVSISQKQCQQKEFKTNLWTYFLVPFLISTALAIFFNLIIPESVDDLFEEAYLFTVLQVLSEIGSPIGHGFSLHIFVYFFMLHNRMSRYEHSYSEQYHAMCVDNEGHEDDGNVPSGVYNDAGKDDSEIDDDDDDDDNDGKLN